MAKKKTINRRVPRSANPRTYGDGKPVQAASSVREAAAPAPLRPAPTLSSQPAGRLLPRRTGVATRPGEGRLAPLSEEYHYVVGDLKRLGALAGGTAALMLVLGLIIH